MFNRIHYGKLDSPNINKHEYKEFFNVEESSNWGIKIYAEWAKQYEESMYILNELSMNAFYIEQYCGFTYRDINTFLRTGVDESRDNSSKKLSTLIAFALTSAPRIPSNLIVYRLVCDDFIKEMVKQNKKIYTPIQEKGFMSVSLIKNLLLKQNEHYNNYKNLLKIYLNQDEIGIYINSIKSAHRNEEEVLLLPGAFLKMIEYPYKDIANNKIIYECKLIPYRYFTKLVK